MYSSGCHLLLVLQWTWTANLMPCHSVLLELHSLLQLSHAFLQIDYLLLQLVHLHSCNMIMLFFMLLIAAMSTGHVLED